MRYPKIRYTRLRGDYLELSSYDGTRRGVAFANEAAASAAVDLDRAAIDLTAIGSGFLPRGAVMVSRAGSGDVDSILDEVDQGDRRDPLATVRLRFSIDLLVRASEWIDKERDREARRRDPAAARRYEGIVDELVAFGFRSGEPGEP